MRLRLSTAFAMATLCFLFALPLTAQQSSARPDAAEKEDFKTQQQKATRVKVGQMAPDFEVEMLDGSRLRLSDLRGKVVMLNFWASWCSPCMKEFRVLPEKIVKAFEGEAFMLLPVNREESRTVVEKKMKDMKASGIDFPVGLDQDRSIYSLYAETYIPRNFLIDSEGRIAYISINYSQEEMEELIHEIKKLLAE